MGTETGLSPQTAEAPLFTVGLWVMILMNDIGTGSVMTTFTKGCARPPNPVRSTPGTEVGKLTLTPLPEKPFNEAYLQGGEFGLLSQVYVVPIQPKLTTGNVVEADGFTY